MKPLSAFSAALARSSTRVRALFCAFLVLMLCSFKPHQPILAPVWARGPLPELAAPLSWAHSHNDYEGRVPLVEALDNQFGSVEADIWLQDGELRISHMGYSFAGTLKELYLDPLQKRVNQQGSVYGDGRPFMLWLDIKGNDPRTSDELQRLLSQYPMLTRFTDQAVKSGPVTIVLTGNSRIKRNYVASNAERFASRDSSAFDDSDPSTGNEHHRWYWYALDWFDHFTWDGVGAMPSEQYARLKKLVSEIHAKGRRLRLWGAPDTPGVWQTLFQAGVDLVGTDFPEGLRRYFGSQQDFAVPRKLAPGLG